MAREVGVEPTITGPEPVALPLGYSRMIIIINVQLRITNLGILFYFVSDFIILITFLTAPLSSPCLFSTK